MTALGNPKLLERVSNGVLTLQALFKEFDKDNNNVVTREEFGQVQCFLSVIHSTQLVEKIQPHDLKLIRHSFARNLLKI